MLEIKQVWNINLESSFSEISKLAESYPYISVSSVWGGFVSRPICYEEYTYKTIKNTIDLVKCLQIAMFFSNSEGRKPSGINCYQFNFTLNERSHVVLEANLDSHKQQGFDPQKALREGISISDFGDALILSGLIINPKIYWVTYHGSYELGYMLSAITKVYLPDSLHEFEEQVKDYFTNVFDVKEMLSIVMPDVKLKGLRSTGKLLEIESDQFFNDQNFVKRASFNALIISNCFFKIIRSYFNNIINENIYNHKLYGLTDKFLLDLSHMNSQRSSKNTKK